MSTSDYALAYDGCCQDDPAHTVISWLLNFSAAYASAGGGRGGVDEMSMNK
jgi:hypothetical protein